MSPTDHYAVAGHPVAHSQSPFIHAMFAAATGQALRYGRLLCPLDEGGFAQAIRTFAEAPGGSVGEFAVDAAAVGGPARGCNVTVPFKFEAFALGKRHSERALLAQAANLLRFDADGWLADNTDGAGLVRDIQVNAGQALAGADVLLVGAGGAAAGVIGPLLLAGPKRLVVVNRTLDKAQALVQRTRGTVCVSGVTDHVLDAKHRWARLSNGHVWMTKITGIGCSATSLIGAFCVVQPDLWRATVAAMAFWGVVGELAAEQAQAAGQGVGSMQAYMLDALQLMDADTFTQRLRLDVAAW